MEFVRDEHRQLTCIMMTGKLDFPLFADLSKEMSRKFNVLVDDPADEHYGCSLALVSLSLSLPLSLSLSLSLSVTE